MRCLSFAALSAVVFAIQGVAYRAIGELLLNDVTSCEAREPPHDDCLGQVETSSRAIAPTIK